MIPEDWLSITLGQACKEKIKTGPFGSQLHAHEYVESGIPVIMPKDLLNGNIIIDKAARISQEKADVLSKHKLENGDLIFSRRGNVTCAAIVTVKEVGCICGTGCLRVRLDKNCVSPPFLNALIQNENVKDWLESNAVGQTMLNLNTTILSNLPIQIPPLLEQCRIAEVLGVWDESIDLLERLIGRVRSRKQGLMQQLLTGKKRFKEFESSEWKTIVFNQIIDKCFDYHGRTPLKIGMEWGDGNIPALSASNVRMGKIDFDRECYFASPELYKKWMTQGDLKKGDVLLTTEAPLGTVAQVPDNELYILSQRVIAIRPKPELLDKSFLFHFMRSKEFQDELDKNSSGSTAKGIQRKRLEKITIKIPSLPEQEKIAAVLSAADEEISTLEKQLAAYKQQKLGLMQQLLTGKIRVGMI
jgi:type I restriction enzyme, S subunit